MSEIKRMSGFEENTFFPALQQRGLHLRNIKEKQDQTYRAMQWPGMISDILVPVGI
ncbi:MAG: hypothetical protein HPY80_01925 [Bacteroidales bacterium]|nr:hypothetical protein [Bacteroidales bacterium]NPV35408.1 hypothetical protein [Bacteroidales bacterium]